MPKADFRGLSLRPKTRCLKSDQFRYPHFKLWYHCVLLSILGYLDLGAQCLAIVRYSDFNLKYICDY